MIRRLVLTALAALPATGLAQQPRYLHVWGTALDTALTIRDSTFTPTRRGVVLATFDLRDGRMTQVIVADTAGRSAHHTEHALAADAQLFANDFGPGRTHRFDMRTLGAPKLLGSFTTAGPFGRPHSFALLPNGNVLTTYQGGHSGAPPGGLAELRRDGNAVRWARAAVAGIDSTQIQPYSLEVIPALDRVVTTSTSMVSRIGMHVQVWRLSDLSLLHTLEVPVAAKSHQHELSTPASHEHHMYPGEPRLLNDGQTVMLGTFTCGLYTLTGLATQPKLAFAASFPGENCAVPVRVGRWWIQTVPELRAVVALDVTDPLEPREATRLTFDAGVRPHWLAADASGTYIAMNSGSANDARIHLLRFDPATGKLSRNALPMIDLQKLTIPGLGVLRIAPHGTIFQ